MVALQESLFDGGPPRPDVTFAGLRRIELDARSWVDHAPGWLQGSDELFTELAGTGRFTQRTVRMYDRTLPEPRLTAGWSTDVADSDLPASLRALSAPLSERYGVEFDRIWVNLYRDGRDSVAWHGDRNRHTHTDPLVATVSLGARRRFLLRPLGGATRVGISRSTGAFLFSNQAEAIKQFEAFNRSFDKDKRATPAQPPLSRQLIRILAAARRAGRPAARHIEQPEGGYEEERGGDPAGKAHPAHVPKSPNMT